MTRGGWLWMAGVARHGSRNSCGPTAGGPGLGLRHAFTQPNPPQPHASHHGAAFPARGFPSERPSLWDPFKVSDPEFFEPQGVGVETMVLGGIAKLQAAQATAAGWLSQAQVGTVRDGYALAAVALQGREGPAEAVLSGLLHFVLANKQRIESNRLACGCALDRAYWAEQERGGWCGAEALRHMLLLLRVLQTGPLATYLLVSERLLGAMASALAGILTATRARIAWLVSATARDLVPRPPPFLLPGLMVCPPTMTSGSDQTRPTCAPRRLSAEQRESAAATRLGGSVLDHAEVGCNPALGPPSSPRTAAPLPEGVDKIMDRTTPHDVTVFSDLLQQSR